METNPPVQPTVGIPPGMPDLIYRSYHQMDEQTDRPREECLRILREHTDKLEERRDKRTEEREKKMDEQSESLEKMMKEMLESQNAITAKLEHIFEWKEAQEKMQKKIIGTMITGGLSAAGYVVYSVFEYFKKRLGM